MPERSPLARVGLIGTGYISRTYLRHATRGWKDGVVDEELSHLLARHARYKWKVQGVSLWEVRDPRSSPEAVSSKAQ